MDFKNPIRVKEGRRQMSHGGEIMNDHFLITYLYIFLMNEINCNS